jgi:hypothetical protein
LQPLDERPRRRMLLLAAVLCAVPMLLLPLAGRSAFEVADERTAFVQRFPQHATPSKTAERALNVARDPFVADAPAAVAGGVVGMHVVQGASMGISVPDAPEVRAIVSGSSPRALIEQSGRVRVVAPGDALSGSTIVRIDGGGLLLKNGTRVRVTEPQR